ncbi:MAG TPA: methionyl-tRNA formyltransferase [Ramlibacter sp.]|jgi:methionyl-tRNA formyltransferase|uniref:methionyl-tRNA formyltransferase n=1 Tax=Ramlibacter sp. TaxID=1917967 RepID=UPI002D36F419|nr:methionyl-tRNA formyltransferase [Ramlibacter sp.]HZY18065.1 methionyl-tRNA formyltransferase [Ramlibacter sp.]
MARIAFIGQQDFGKAVMEAFIARGDVIAGVFCAPDKPGAKPDALRAGAERLGLQVFSFPSLRSEEAARTMRALDADLGIMAYVLQFAPQSFVNLPRHGTIQFHPSLLPRHRGPSSISWPVALGAAETGVTVFRPTDGLDEGPVVLQKACPIGADETVGELYFNKLFPMGVQALLEAADLVLAGRHQERVQDESQATYEGWMHDEEARIHWGAPVDHVYNLIRACNPAPGAWTMLGDTRLRLYDARKHVVGRFAPGGHKPGDIAGVTPHSIVFWSQGGLVEVLKVRPEGGGKMDAGEFARQRGLAISDAWRAWVRPAASPAPGRPDERRPSAGRP